MSSGVAWVGNTVRRPAGPWTSTVHALLAHLHEAGFEGAPRPLCIDEHGREVLTFIPGTPAWPGQFHLLDDDAQLSRAARLIRDFHDAVATFTPPPGARSQVLTPADGDEIIAHHDLAPWNLIIGHRQWAFIDWDTAAPGTRLWDLAYAMHGFAPLSTPPTSAPTRAAGCASSSTPTTSPNSSAMTSFRCSDAAPRPCTPSSPSRPPWATSPGHAYGRKATAPPGRQTPATSPSAQTTVAKRSSNNPQPQKGQIS
jgi:hypothetical protein